MSSTAERLRSLLKMLDIPNIQLAKAISIDPSLVSRWLSSGFGKRRAEEHALSIGRYIASRRWGQEADRRLAACLSLPEGESVTAERVVAYLLPGRYPGSEPSPSMLTGFREAVAASRSPEIAEGTYSLCRQAPEIAALVDKELAAAEPGSRIDIFLTSESIACAAEPELLRIMREHTAKSGLKWRILIQSSNNRSMSGRLISAYMAFLVQGRLELSILQGTPQTFTASLNLLIPNRSAVIVTEVIRRRSDAVAAVIRDRGTVEDLVSNFEETLRFSRPLMTAYDDAFIQNIIELFAQEYCTPGSLDVVKSGMNPMYYSPEEYGRILKKLGMTGAEYDWRIKQFCELSGALDGMMNCSRSREVLSLGMLRQIVETGRCRMPGMYFMSSGICWLDREDIAALLDDYIRYMEAYPDFHMILLDDDSLFSPNSCWHIKSNHHVTIHTWDIDSPVLVVSDRMMVIDEFQRYFDSLWDKAAAGTTDRDTIRELRHLRDLCLAGAKNE